jgi:hypothetical protein
MGLLAVTLNASERPGVNGQREYFITIIKTFIHSIYTHVNIVTIRGCTLFGEVLCYITFEFLYGGID